MQVLTKYFPGGFFGEDKEGFPVYYEFIGNLDFKGSAFYMCISIMNPL